MLPPGKVESAAEPELFAIAQNVACQIWATRLPTMQSNHKEVKTSHLVLISSLLF